MNRVITTAIAAASVVLCAYDHGPPLFCHHAQDCHDGDPCTTDRCLPDGSCHWSAP